MPVLDAVTSIRVGVDAVDRVYVGTDLVWSRSVGGALSVRTTDTATAVDTAHVSAAQVGGADVATSTETETVDQAGQTLSGPDTATTVETALTYVQVADADVATSTEIETLGVQDQAKTDADTASTVETATVSATRADADTAGTVEGNTVSQQASQIVERTKRVTENNGGSSVQANTADAQLGDFMLIVGTAANAISISSGWTPLFTPTTYAGNGYGAWYRWKNGQAADTPTITGGSSGRVSAIAACFGGVHSTSPFDVALALDTSEGSTSLTLPAITTITAKAMVIISGAVDATSADYTLSGPSASFPQDIQTTGQGRRQALAAGPKATPGSTGSFTWSQASGLNLTMIGFTLALRPVGEGDGLTTLIGEDVAQAVETAEVLVSGATPISDADTVSTVEAEALAATRADADTAGTVEGETRTQSQAGFGTSPFGTSPFGTPPGASGVSESWTGANGAPWPTGWQATNGAGATQTIQSGRGRLVPSGGWASAWLSSMTAQGDVDLTVSFLASGGLVVVGMAPAATQWVTPDGSHYVRCEVTGTTAGYVSLFRNTGGNTELGFAYAGVTAGADGWMLRLQRTGTTVRVKVWTAGGAEPGAWLVSATDPAPPSPLAGKVFLGCSGTCDFDNLIAT